MKSCCTQVAVVALFVIAAISLAWLLLQWGCPQCSSLQSVASRLRAWLLSHGEDPDRPHIWHSVDWAAWERGDLLLTNSEHAPYTPEVGNGYIATVVGSSTLFAAGVFNGYDAARAKEEDLSDLSHRAHIPAPLALDVKGHFTDAALDLRRAIYSRHYNVSSSGGSAHVELQFYAHRSRRSLLVVQMVLAAHQAEKSFANFNGDHVISVEVVRSNGFPAIQGLGSNDFKWRTQELDSGAFSEHPCILFEGHTQLPELADSPTMKVAMVFPANASGVKAFVLKLRNEGTPRVQMTWIAAVRTSLDSIAPAEDAKVDYLKAVGVSAEQLYAEHTAAWAELWKSGFEVTGRVDVARAVNSSLYYVLSSLREDAVHSLSPGGLASNGYMGHSFWDCETWIYPTLVLWHPNLARSLLQYRAERTEQSEKKAKSYEQGYSGAMFAWESAATGAEVCPETARTGELEHHITGDIAIALQQFWYATGNLSALRELYPNLLKKTADFWVSRVTWDSDGRLAHINDVIPPDEYARGNDSVYTNYVAHRNLVLADELASILDEPRNPSWRKVAAAIPILVDGKRGIHPEHRRYKGERIKQADVVLLAYPLMMTMPAEMQRKDLKYYTPRTDADGPAMTWAMHAIGHMVLRDQKNANSNFERSFANVKLPYYVWSENPTGGVQNFITGAGGFLQAVLFGVAGIRLFEDHLAIDPWVDAVDRITSFVARGIHYQSSILSLSVDRTRLTLSVDSGPSIYVTAVDKDAVEEGSNGVTLISPGQARSFPVGRIRVRTPRSTRPAFTLDDSQRIRPLTVDTSGGTMRINRTRRRARRTKIDRNFKLTVVHGPVQSATVIAIGVIVVGILCWWSCSEDQMAARSEDRRAARAFRRPKIHHQIEELELCDFRLVE